MADAQPKTLVKPGRGLDFDGTGSFVDCGYFLTDSYTKEVWFRIDPKRGSNSTNNLVSGADGGHALRVARDTGAQKVSAGHDSTPGTWNQVIDPDPVGPGWQQYTVTYDAATTCLRLYRNGTLVSENVRVAKNVDTGVLLGSWKRTAGCFLGGSLNEVRIWNRARTAAEVSAGLRAELTGSEAGLLAHYTFDVADPVNVKDLLKDHSASGYYGKLTRFTQQPGCGWASAEVLDTSDEATRTVIRGWLDRFLNAGPVRTSTGTTEKPVTVTAGFVFCQFKDVKGSDIAALRTTLLGNPDEFSAFVARESGGRVKIAVATYTAPNTSGGSWVTLSEDHANYVGDADKVFTEVDNLIEFPNDWDIAMFAFPAKPADSSTVVGKAYDTKTDGYWLRRSHCTNGHQVDVPATGGGAGQKINFLFLDPSHYSDGREAQYLVIHEAIHALGLRDLYFGGTNRSYGWSVMSDMRTGWHLTAFEKLVLGWAPLSDYVFLKRGIIGANVVAQGTAGTKGVVILPDDTAYRSDIRVVEVAQTTGRTAADKTTFAADHPDGNGLLLLMADPTGARGRVVPFVNARPDDDDAAQKRYGGASKAPFAVGASFTTNGVFGYSITTADKGTTYSCVVGVDDAYVPPGSARTIRENGRIVGGGHVFAMTSTGALTLDGKPCLEVNNAKAPAPQDDSDASKLYHTDYGYCLFVDDSGIVRLAKATAPTSEKNRILATFATPANTTLPALKDGESYALTVEDVGGVGTVAVYKRESKTGGLAETRQYSLFVGA